MNRKNTLRVWHVLALATALLGLASLPRIAHAQTSDEDRLAGTEFYVAYMLNEDKRGAAPLFMGLMISSEVATTADVEIPSVGVRQYFIRPGQTTTINVPRSLEMRFGEEPPQPAIHITSRAPISVNVLNSLYQSNGGYTAVPVDKWGMQYIPMALPNADGERVCEFLVVAAYEGTILTITPSTQTNYKEPGQDITKSLKKGEAYLVQARLRATGTGDLSTSEIRASRPVGVIAGHMRAPITADRSMPLDRWASHFSTMLLPDNHWSREYVTAPMRPGTADRFRMTPSVDNTTIEITHFPAAGAPEKITVTLDRGELYDSATINGKPITGPVHWVASNPTLLVQMRTSDVYGNAENSPAILQAVGLDQMTTMSPFASPQFIGASTLNTHTLSIVAKGNGALDPNDDSNPIRSITLDGKLLGEVSPGVQWQKITGDYFHTRIPISAGAHVLRSADGYPFTGSVSGHSGLFGDFYTFLLPFWVPKTQADVRPPIVINRVSSSQEGFLIAQISDRDANAYFSGVADVQVVNSPGWRLSMPFTPPSPDDDINVTFSTAAEPSGPLYAELRDWNGNKTTVQLSDGLCRNTAYPAEKSVVIRSTVGTAKRHSLAVRANPCGYAAKVLAIDPGTGNAKNYVTIGFDSGLPIDIPAGGEIPLNFDVASGTPAGIYITTLHITLDTGSFDLPLRLEVEPPAGIAFERGEHSLGLTLAPNPFHGAVRIGFARVLGEHASVTISDALGRQVRRFDGEQLDGRDVLVWDGADDNGRVLPSGVYIVSAADARGRSAASATLVR